jgi:spermidine synthase
VVDIARKYLKSVHKGSLDDPRLTLRIGDGFAFVRDSAETFDLVVLDLTDPGGPSTALYTADFYEACAARLTAQGAMTMHIASPIAHAARIREALAELRNAFARVTPYLTSVPLYGGLWMMACCSQTLDPRDHSAAAIESRILERKLGRLQYINGDTYRAALALPNFVRALVA